MRLPTDRGNVVDIQFSQEDLIVLLHRKGIGWQRTEAGGIEVVEGEPAKNRYERRRVKFGATRANQPPNQALKGFRKAA